MNKETKSTSSDARSIQVKVEEEGAAATTSIGGHDNVKAANIKPVGIEAANAKKACELVARARAATAAVIKFEAARATTARDEAAASTSSASPIINNDESASLARVKAARAAYLKAVAQRCKNAKSEHKIAQTHSVLDVRADAPQATEGFKNAFPENKLAKTPSVLDVRANAPQATEGSKNAFSEYKLAKTPSVLDVRADAPQATVGRAAAASGRTEEVILASAITGEAFTLSAIAARTAATRALASGALIDCIASLSTSDVRPSTSGIHPNKRLLTRYEIHQVDAKLLLLEACVRVDVHPDELLPIYCMDPEKRESDFELRLERLRYAIGESIALIATQTDLSAEEKKRLQNQMNATETSRKMIKQMLYRFTHVE